METHMPHVQNQPTTSTETVAHLNDCVRLGLDPRAGIVVTANCLATFADDGGMPLPLLQAQLFAAFRHCDFDADSPERDFASIVFADRKVWMKIDYYDLDLQFGSEDPADPAVTTRVMTILLPEDW